jgi:hypothetical protein
MANAFSILPLQPCAMRDDLRDMLAPHLQNSIFGIKPKALMKWGFLMHISDVECGPIFHTTAVRIAAVAITSRFRRRYGFGLLRQALARMRLQQPEERSRK